MKASTELDVTLLCKALRSALVNYERALEVIGYDGDFIRRATELDYSLLNRIEIGMTAKEVSR